MLDILKQALGKQVSVLTAEVISVDEQARTCTVKPLGSDAQFIGVPLQAATMDNGEGYLLVPRVGSIVGIGILDESAADGAFVIQTTALEKSEQKIGNISMKMSGSDVVFNDGSNGGVVKWQELKVQIEQIKSFCEGLRSAFTAWVPVPGDGGAVLFTALKAALPLLQTGNFENLSDPKLKH
jgi:hypothetical protein